FSYQSSNDHRNLHSFPTRRSSDLTAGANDHKQGTKERTSTEHGQDEAPHTPRKRVVRAINERKSYEGGNPVEQIGDCGPAQAFKDRKSTRLNSSHDQISYAVFCLK